MHFGDISECFVWVPEVRKRFKRQILLPVFPTSHQHHDLLEFNRLLDMGLHISPHNTGNAPSQNEA